MYLNTDCSSYLGVYIAENLLPDIFENPKIMPYGNPGFDVKCENDYKIDVKSRCTLYEKINGEIYESWKFPIKQNKIADYFLLIAFNNRNDLKVLHIWLIKGNKSINNKFSKNVQLNKFQVFTIMNATEALNRYKKFELTQEKLDKANVICVNFKKNVE